MFKNRTTDGRNNLCGAAVARLRRAERLSQRMLAERLQLLGLDVDKNAVQRIESGQRFVTDIELLALSRVFSVEIRDLISE
ncbi:MAG: helix-turn-helix transcriptional regulator [Clostridia bacterium]|nr:helix-turn-helix transcriptional regulator [Clostridia bacterium]